MMFPVIYIPFLPVSGMAIFPFIFIKSRRFKHNPVLMRHEKIHLIQQLELFFFIFFVLYFLHYLVNLIKYRNHHLAYMNIAFEREAYVMEQDGGYIKSRPYFNWIRFVF